MIASSYILLCVTALASLSASARFIRAPRVQNGFTVEDVKCTLKETGVDKDVFSAWSLDDIKVPFNVKFGNASVVPGMNLTVEQTANMPSFSIASNDKDLLGKVYFVAMVDPDAPTPQNRSLAQIMHYLGPDFISSPTGWNEMSLCNKSEALAEYVRPDPPSNSDPHRYSLGLFMQDREGAVQPPTGFNASNIVNFNLTKFTEDVGQLRLISATMFFVGPSPSG